MARPTIGPVPRTRVVSVRVTQAEYELIRAGGLPPTGFMRMLLDRATAEAGEVQSTQEGQVEPAEPSPVATEEAFHAADMAAYEARHRHKRERTGDHWVAGINVGTWKCSECHAPLDP